MADAAALPRPEKTKRVELTKLSPCWDAHTPGDPLESESSSCRLQSNWDKSSTVNQSILHCFFGTEILTPPPPKKTHLAQSQSPHRQEVTKILCLLGMLHFPSLHLLIWEVGFGWSQFHILFWNHRKALKHILIKQCKSPKSSLAISPYGPLSWHKHEGPQWYN